MSSEIYIDLTEEINFSNIKNKTDIKSKIKCMGVKSDGDSCDKNAKDENEHEGKFYCSIHYKKATEIIIKCEALKKDNTQCDKKATKDIDGENYCTVHYKKITEVITIMLTKYHNS